MILNGEIMMIVAFFRYLKNAFKERLEEEQAFMEKEEYAKRNNQLADNLFFRAFLLKEDEFQFVAVFFFFCSLFPPVGGLLLFFGLIYEFYTCKNRGIEEIDPLFRLYF